MNDNSKLGLRGLASAVGLLLTALAVLVAITALWSVFHNGG